MADRPGYISVHRKIQDNWLWSDKPFNKGLAWIDILLSAQFHDSKVVIGGQVIDVPRGSWFVSVKTLETRWGWSSNKIRTFFRTLERDGMIQAEGTARGTLLTIVKYEDYQSVGKAKGKAEGIAEGTTEGIADGRAEGKTEGAHTNKGNKGNKENKSMASVLRKCTFEEDEIERNIDLCSNGKSPFPNIDIENEYFRIAMAKREERERNG